MLLEPPSETVLHRTFERVLIGILNGSLPAALECNGLDEQTRAVLNSLVGQTTRSRPPRSALRDRNSCASSTARTCSRARPTGRRW